MVLGVVQRREAHPVGLDLRAIGDVEAHRPEDRLDALDRARHRMQTALAAAPAGQRDVERLRMQLRIELGLRERQAALLQRGLDALLHAVDRRAARFLLVDRERAERLEQLGDTPGLAEEARFRVLQFGRSRRSRELLLRALHQLVQVVHSIRSHNAKRKDRPPPGGDGLSLGLGARRTAAVPVCSAALSGRRSGVFRRARPSPWRRCCRRQPGR
jgi:hypothetical protein